MHANGSVTVRPLPKEVHGAEAEISVPLRRLLEGGPVEQQELDDFLAKELLKVATFSHGSASPPNPCQLRLH